jgi:hypothetical protein
MRKTIASLLAASVLLLGACASDDEPTAGSGGTGGETSGATGRAPGVTDTAIKVGILIPDAEVIRRVAPDTDYGDWEGAYQAVIDHLNEEGVHGRKLDPIFVVVDPTQAAAAEAACLKVTEDEQVFVATGVYFGDPLCLLEAHETAFVGGQAGISEAALARAKAPWFATGADDLLSRMHEAFDEAGLLDDDFALLVDAGHEPQVRDVVLPTLEKLGKEPVEIGVINTPPNDTAAAEAQTKVFAEKFKTAGAKTVLLEGFAQTPWANVMEKDSSYRPVLLQPTGIAGANSLTSVVGRDFGFLEGAHVADTYGPPQRVWEEEDMQECIAVIEEAGIEVPAPDTLEKGEPTQYGSVFPACQQIALLGAILEKAGEDLDYATFDKAGTTLGEVKLPGSPDPFDYGSGLARGGQAPVSLFKWDPAKKEYLPAS